MKRDINPCFISSYVPKKCGIATFTQNLFHSYQNSFANKGRVIAVDDQLNRNFPSEVDFVFDRNKASDYARAAEHINSSDLHVVNLQHEFGLFGGPEGRLITKLLEKLKKPVVTTVHTVLQDPNLGYYTSLMEVIQHSDRLVVMSHKAIEILQEVYYVPPEKIVMIPHGVPDLPFSDPDNFKAEMGVEGRFVLLTFGLLSPGKGVEMVLEALPGVVREHPEVIYIILGKTHPEVARIHGESYRESLQKIVRDHSLENNVMFIDKFFSNEELFRYISGANIYITPYLSPEQITSGTLAYAVGLGKVVVSTPYWYARELLADGRGRLVPFSNPKALADTLNELLSKREYLNEMSSSSYAYGREMIWSRVSEKYHALFREVCKEHSLKVIKRVSAIRKGSLDNLGNHKILNMFERITDDTGMFQFTLHGIPDLKHGYSADDAGRALEVIIRWARAVNHIDNNFSGEYRLAQKYLSFLHYVQIEDGRFHNFVSYDRRYLDEVGSEDTFGRVLAGLGSAIAWSGDQSITLFARDIFDRAIDRLPPDRPLSDFPKALAYAICGLYGYLHKYPESLKAAGLLRSGADYLIELYETNKSTNWHWFEHAVTYGNAKVPYSLMLAYNVFKDKRYLDTALESLDFLTNIQYDGTCFDLIGNKGWLYKGAKRACFDQQPIEIGYLVEAYCEALRLTRKEEYRTLATKAFNWFFGNNRLGVPVYNANYDYPLDGLHASGSNSNSGAESVISFALAVTALKETKIRKAIGNKEKRGIIKNQN
ncbi:glycosyltransferase [Pelotomaculum terephthalicicum JT]|uniref:glycosyltransferase n=1 Tax=Pelotomaculum TaxID=191373 RepID=UPI0009CF767A|nr:MULTISPECIES: glycosyltransferase [Pelotomaculum]MCG9968847.1 glycosyltransferase [Pelotomaculum terephthalicicum JT]OPX85092.1 MAG: Spore coat protein SA [Pelotomaculum sp. PtaB.Bin117]OPY59495.1 MAG: Spore coat protein SA [Pelotomaculum sp. PtaU1.Bin035]